MDKIIGSELAGFRILEQIGQGGMAKVYKAYQPGMDRVVALKILPDLYAADETARQRFRQEAQIIASLEHPHILPVYDYGEDDEAIFLVMRYLQAGNLKNIIASAPDGRLGLADAALLVEQIASALDYAHQKGIVHRDVKPANVLIDPHGQAFLTDFGIAKVLEATQELTRTGSTLGTPAYMSPEQASGGEVDHRSDIYSLGIILYQMLTGKPPFEADTPYATIVAHLEEPLPLPSARNPEIPEAVEQVLLKALSKDPDDRYQAAGELAQALLQAVQEGSGEFRGETVTPAFQDLSRVLAAERPGGELTERDLNLLSQITRTRRRQRLVPWLVGGFFLMVLVAAGGLIFRARQMASRPGEVITLTPSSNLGLTETASALQTALNSTLTAPTLSSPTPSPSLTITPTPTPVIEPYISNPYQGPVPEGAIARLGKGTIEQIDLSPDGNILAIGGSLGVWLMDIEENIYTGYLEYYEQINSLKWSPEGDKIAAGLENGFVIVWDTQSGEQLHTFARHIGPVYDLDWDPNGFKLASGSEDGSIIIWNTQSGNHLKTLQGDSGPVRAVDWSPDSHAIASAVTNNVFIWNPYTGMIEETIHNKHLTDDLSIGDIAWAPNNNDKLAVAGWSGVTVYHCIPHNVDNVEIIWEQLSIQKVKEIAWSESGQTLSAVQESGETFLLTGNRGEPTQLELQNSFHVVSAAWKGAETNLILQDRSGSIISWEGENNYSEISSSKLFSPRISSVSWSPDGVHIAGGGLSGSVSIWEIDSFSPTQQLSAWCGTEYSTNQPINPTPLRNLSWSYDGERLAGYSCDAIQLWSTNSWNHIYKEEINQHLYPNGSLTFSPTSYLLAASHGDCYSPGNCIFNLSLSDGYPRGFWGSIASAEIIDSYTFHSRTGGYLYSTRIESVAFSPDGIYIASSSTSEIIISKSPLYADSANVLVYNQDNWLNRIIWKPSIFTAPIQISWSPNNQYLAGGSDTIKIFDPISGDLIQELDGHTGKINSINWHPNGKFLVSASEDKTVILWDINESEVYAVLEGHHGPVTEVSISPDGKTLASSSMDGSIILWDLTKLLP